MLGGRVRAPSGAQHPWLAQALPLHRGEVGLCLAGPARTSPSEVNPENLQEAGRDGPEEALQVGERKTAS